MRLTICLDEDEVRILKKRAKKNLFSLREQVEDIVRRSCVSYSGKRGYKGVKVDDRLVEAFSRDRRGRPRKRKSMR